MKNVKLDSLIAKPIGLALLIAIAAFTVTLFRLLGTPPTSIIMVALPSVIIIPFSFILNVLRVRSNKK